MKKKRMPGIFRRDIVVIFCSTTQPALLSTVLLATGTRSPVCIDTLPFSRSRTTPQAV
jgi:hypothetical protein